MRYFEGSCIAASALALACSALIEMSSPASAQGFDRRSRGMVMRPASRPVIVRPVARSRATIVRRDVRSRAASPTWRERFGASNQAKAQSASPGKGKQSQRPASVLRRNPGSGPGGTSIGEARRDSGPGSSFAGSPSREAPPVVLASPSEAPAARRQAPGAVVAPAQAAPARSAAPRLPVGAAVPSAPGAAPALSALVAPGAQSAWDHNGSVMRVAAEAGVVRFHYDQPRRGLSDLGIRSGSLLVTARNTGANAYAGEVVTFSRKCGDMTFPVAGEASSDGTRLVLNGSKPTRDGRCRVTGSRPEMLIFALRPLVR